MKLRIALILTSLLASPVVAEESYREPPAEITDIVTRAPSPVFSFSPDKETILKLERVAVPPVSEIAIDDVSVAGMRINPKNNAFPNPRPYLGLSLESRKTGETRLIELPQDADIRNYSWSHDSRFVVLTNQKDDGHGVLLLDIEAGEVREILASGVNPIHERPTWLPDGRLLLLAMPEDRPAMPERPKTPVGPSIQDAVGGEEAHIRTYTNLLSNPYDERLYEWLVTSQPAILDPQTGEVSRIAEPRLYTNLSTSPDGQYILAQWVERPFSYQSRWRAFPSVTAILTLTGEHVVTLDEKPLTEDLPVGGVYDGPRGIGWHPTEDSTIMWLEALDGGDPRVETDTRDRLMALQAPFDGDADVVFTAEDRITRVSGIEASDDMIVGEYDRDTREIRQTFIDLRDGNPDRVWNLRNAQDAYDNPGYFMTTRTPQGKTVAIREGSSLFLRGQGATPEGRRPFLRKLDMDDFGITEIWRNNDESLESVLDIFDSAGPVFLTSHETPASPPNYRLHDNGTVKTLSDFPDPHPELTGIKRELVTYERSDGVELTAELYLPADYEEGQKLPLIIVAYPREYNDASTAAQNRDTPYSFTTIRASSPLFLVTQGYAVLDSASMPVIGSDPETVNDTFLKQIVDSAQAAIDFSVERGFGDGHRVGVMGHSYGAFMTANLLAHSDLFRTGIARSGAYNRTLTPFGFQSERRIFWDAKDVYYNLSPFMAADQINEPLLLIHGADDSNPGTYPIQSERMFAAIKGTGGTARLVMLPHESHGYRGRESILHVLAETIDWFDQHVKNAEVPE